MTLPIWNFDRILFPPYAAEEEDINPGRYGERLAEFLAEQLSARGFTVAGIDAEDWGWRIDLQHEE